eukprot:GHVN01102696.1.p1 GENE.GHVN01102696.1~~GHVN01102696.1.p1  ORF type:complete len:102 (-),score=4.83 GHVN01102696.1:16-321(-)
MNSPLNPHRQLTTQLSCPKKLSEIVFRLIQDRLSHNPSTQHFTDPNKTSPGVLVDSDCPPGQQGSGLALVTFLICEHTGTPRNCLTERCTKPIMVQHKALP